MGERLEQELAQVRPDQLVPEHEDEDEPGGERGAVARESETPASDGPTSEAPPAEEPASEAPASEAPASEPDPADEEGDPR